MAPLERRKQILIESARLFAERGIAATTVREIGDAVGLNSGTLYHYFRSKDAIVTEVLTSFLNDLAERYASVLAEPATATERLRRIVHTSFEVAGEHPYATEIYQNESSSPTSLPGHQHITAAVGYAHNAWNTVAEQGVRSGEFSSGVDVFEFQRMMRECVFMSVRWHRQTLRRDTEWLTDTLMTVFLDGFAHAPAPHDARRRPSDQLREVGEAGLPDDHPQREFTRISDVRAELEALRSEVHALKELVQQKPASAAVG